MNNITYKQELSYTLKDKFRLVKNIDNESNSLSLVYAMNNLTLPWLIYQTFSIGKFSAR